MSQSYFINTSVSVVWLMFAPAGATIALVSLAKTFAAPAYPAGK